MLVSVDNLNVVLQECSDSGRSKISTNSSTGQSCGLAGRSRSKMKVNTIPQNKSNDKFNIHVQMIVHSSIKIPGCFNRIVYIYEH